MGAIFKKILITNIIKNKIKASNNLQSKLAIILSKAIGSGFNSAGCWKFNVYKRPRPGINQTAISSSNCTNFWSKKRLDIYIILPRYFK